MTKFFATIAILSVASFASAASVSTSVSFVEVNATQAGNGAPEGGTIFSLFTTTDLDILSVNDIVLTTSDGSTPYNETTFGSDTAPSSALEGLAGFERLQADSYITTPGAATSSVGADANFNDLPSIGNATWFDTTADGAQNNFQFARITLNAGVTGLLTGRISTNDGGTPFDQPFSIALGVPEPSTAILAALGVVGFVARRRG